MPWVDNKHMHNPLSGSFVYTRKDIDFHRSSVPPSALPYLEAASDSIHQLPPLTLTYSLLVSSLLLVISRLYYLEARRIKSPEFIVFRGAIWPRLKQSTFLPPGFHLGIHPFIFSVV